MKPVVSASQIAVQAYAQRTGTPARVAGQSPFTVDGKGLSAKSVGPVRRVALETDAFKVEISAEALEAANRLDVGIAQTLCSLSPVFILPFAAKLHKERIGPRAIFGSIVTVAGVAVLVAGRG